MARVNPRLAAWGVAMIALGILLAFLIDPPALRLLGSITPIAIGFGLLRQAFRLE